MKCPSCGSTDSGVTDSRRTRDATEIRRRRKCESCGHVYTTYELIYDDRADTKGGLRIRLTCAQEDIKMLKQKIEMLNKEVSDALAVSNRVIYDKTT